MSKIPEVILWNNFFTESHNVYNDEVVSEGFTLEFIKKILYEFVSKKPPTSYNPLTAWEIEMIVIESCAYWFTEVTL